MVWLKLSKFTLLQGVPVLYGILERNKSLAYLSVAYLHICHPFITRFIPANTSLARFAIVPRRSIHTILPHSGLSQIDDPIIRPAAIDVVERPRWPVSIIKKPSYAMGIPIFPPNAYRAIAIRPDTASYHPRLYSHREHLQPAKFPSIWVIGERFLDYIIHALSPSYRYVPITAEISEVNTIDGRR